MKYIIAIILVVSLSAFDAFAQNNPPQNTYQRLLDTRYESYSNGVYTPIDSERYTYSGTRGGGGYLYQGEGKQLFDLKQSFSKNGSTWFPSARTTKSYDVNNNMLTFIREISTDGITWNNGQKEEHIYVSNHSVEDTVITYGGNGTLWIGQTKQIRSFNSQGEQTQNITQNFDNTTQTWINSSKSELTYDAAHRLLSTLSTQWKNGTWENYSLSTATYDANENLLSNYRQLWDVNHWKDYSKTIDSYDVHNRILTIFTQDSVGIYNPNTMLVEMHFHEDSTIISYANNVDSKYSSYRTVNFDTIWHNTSLEINTFLPNNQGYRTQSFIGDTLPNIWDSSFRSFYYNDANGRQVEDSLQEFVSPNNWVTVERGSNQFDAAGNILADYSKSNNLSGANTGFKHEIMSYIPSGQLKTYEAFQWLNGKEAPYYRNFYSYEDYVGPASVIVPSQKITSRAYPNPFTHTFTIEFNSDKPQGVSLLLYDITGKLLTRTVTTAEEGRNTIQWDAAGFQLPAGAYTYELIVGNTIGTGKMVVK